MIYTSKPYLPTLKNYNKYLKRIWKNHTLTNDGPMVRELEIELGKYWGVKNVICVANGTLALEIAIKALDIQKKIYVSPLSFIATISAPMWQGVKPEFVDLGQKFKSPALITHVYGEPVVTDVSPVIYDASHAFPVKYKGRYLVSYGDISIVSFHATKVFHSVEGGALIIHDDGLAEKARKLRNFGFNGAYNFDLVGINAKMSEFHAAMGLCNLKTINRVVKKYKHLEDLYNRELGLKNNNLTYYPIFYQSEADLEQAVAHLENNGVSPKRYFYPSLNRVFSKQRCPVAENMAKTVLCLPFYYDLKDSEVEQIVKLVKETL